MSSVSGDELICLSAQSDNIDLWHRRLGYVSSSLLNKLIARYLIHGILKIKVLEDKICDACVKENKTSSSFKQENMSVQELLHIDLCGPVKVQSIRGKKYMVILDDFSGFSLTMFLRSKEETYEIFKIFIKRVQVKYGVKLKR